MKNEHNAILEVQVRILGVLLTRILKTQVLESSLRLLQEDLAGMEETLSRRGKKYFTPEEVHLSRMRVTFAQRQLYDAKQFVDDAVEQLASINGVATIHKDAFHDLHIVEGEFKRVCWLVHDAKFTEAFQGMCGDVLPKGGEENA